ncbi:hypothetical protein J2Z28_006341 [Paenibacillus xylanexedens]|uniref:Uncharacterized protein n=1 Tax=Paenibacillus xylanexedens TaxID=528191 RepID=A0ABS4S3E3_PAEXY|nr:hypothetical protein [Paenibacillus xylanexedens]
MASDFNRQERWEKEIGGQESTKALPPPNVRCAQPKKVFVFAQLGYIPQLRAKQHLKGEHSHD